MQVAPTPEPLKETVLPDVVPVACLMSFAISPTEILVLATSMDSAKTTLGFTSSILCSSARLLLLFKKPLFLLVRPRPRRLRRIPEIRKRQAP